MTRRLWVLLFCLEATARSKVYANFIVSSCFSLYLISATAHPLRYSNICFSESKPNFFVEPPWIRLTKVCSRHLYHMNKMAAMSIYGKNPSNIFFSRTSGPISTKLGM